jgi:hypothetical protein
MPKASKEYCQKTPIKKMGFTQKSSCKAQGFIKRTSKTNKGKYIVSPKYKSKNKSLYSSGKNKPKIKTGYKDKETAELTLKNLKGFDINYKKQVINTMYNRAKYHQNQTENMRKAMRIFKKWLNSHK